LLDNKLCTRKRKPVGIVKVWASTSGVLLLDLGVGLLLPLHTMRRYALGKLVVLKR
jgi:hypothetical protein